jgi:hypothetical protein
MPVTIVPDDATLPIIFFDGTAVEVHVLEGTPTDNPTETGEPVTDHFIKAPADFSCEVRTSATPSRPDLVLVGEGQILPLTLQYAPKSPSPILFPSPPYVLPKQTQSLQFPGLPDRIKRTWQQLESMWSGVALCSVYTTRKVYNSMILTHVDETVANIYMGKFKLAFRQIKRVQTQTATAPQPKEPRGVPPSNLGPKNPLDDGSNIAKKWYDQFVGDKSVALGLAQKAGLASP